eukprot:Clim_evm18s26 gene=Clim_evmTU18s26
MSSSSTFRAARMAAQLSSPGNAVAAGVAVGAATRPIRGAKFHTAIRPDALNGKRALVTNVLGFTGIPVSKALKNAGAEVVCHDESFKDESKASQFLRAEGQGLNVAPGVDWEELIPAVEQKYGPVDILINNDDYPAIRAKIEDAKPEQLRENFEYLAVRPYNLTGQYVAAYKKRNGKSGRIIFMGSSAPLRGLSNYSLYTVGRGATIAMVNSLGLELAKMNVTVNMLANNFVRSETYFPQKLLADPEKYAKIVKNIPMGRLGEPEECAALVTYLACDDAAWITGQVIPFSGGWV